MKKSKLTKWYEQITDTLYEKFQIDIPLLSGAALFDDIEDSMDLQALLDELDDQRDYCEQCGFPVEYDLHAAIKSVRQSKYGYDEFDY